MLRYIPSEAGSLPEAPLLPPEARKQWDELRGACEQHPLLPPNFKLKVCFLSINGRTTRTETVRPRQHQL